MNPSITLSVVSHGQGLLVENLLESLSPYNSEFDNIIVTLNMPEPAIKVPTCLKGRVSFRLNDVPAGFGANHNAVIAQVDSDLVCVLNPDLCFISEPFKFLSETLAEGEVALVAPKIISPAGIEEDSVRSFITVGDILAKVWLKLAGKPQRSSLVCHESGPVEVDWVGGMFMMIRKDAFNSIGGFDERFFLYYEDVDLCARFKKSGWTVMYDPRAEVIHDARLTSHTNWRYLKWHLSSMLRYFIKHGFFRFR
jgi:GT2 family glycosyltransferase